MSKPPIALEERRSEDARLFSPSAGRNKSDIAAALSGILPIGASVLEIGSGTGEHGIESVTQRPDLKWQFSDPDKTSRASQLAWSELSLNEFPKPLSLDMSDETSRAQITAQYDAIFSANMIHIAPISALHGLADLAAQALVDSGKMILYGPFLRGEASAPSNLAFDASLKRRNSAWGVRDLDAVKHIFAKRGFNVAKLRDMPKNNFILDLSRV
jgi:cyclopropane fatty-acyl-phospholipid synthase-like methyltransferase